MTTLRTALDAHEFRWSLYLAGCKCGNWSVQALDAGIGHRAWADHREAAVREALAAAEPTIECNDPAHMSSDEQDALAAAAAPDEEGTVLMGHVHEALGKRAREAAAAPEGERPTAAPAEAGER